MTATATEPEEPQVSDETPKKGNPKKSDYVVMYCLDKNQDFSTAEEAVRGGDWNYAGEYTVVDNGGQRAARKQALDDAPELVAALNDGGYVHWLCLPRRSLHPFTSALEQRDPTLVI